MNVQLRFNHNAINDNYRWRLIVNGHEHHVSEVVFLCPCATTMDEVIVDGKKEVKWHVSVSDAYRVHWEHGGEGFCRAVIQ